MCKQITFANKLLLQPFSMDTIITYYCNDVGVQTLPKGIIPKENKLARLLFELAYCDVASPAL